METYLPRWPVGDLDLVKKEITLMLVQMSEKRRNSIASIGMVLATLLLTCPGVAQNLVLNSSFEKPIVGNGSYTVFPVGGSPVIPHWTVVGASGQNVFIASTTLCDPGPPKVCYPAQDGKQFLDLTGAGSNGSEGVLSDPIATVNGQYYQLSYWVGNVSLGGSYGTTSTVQVYINGILLSSDTNSMSSPVDGNGTYSQVWQQFIHVFQAGSSTTTVKFLNGDPSTDGINGLDNVVLLHICQCKRAGSADRESKMPE
jgi:hypothetical protein